MKFKFKKDKDRKVDYLHLDKKERWKIIILFVLKWAMILLVSDAFIAFILYLFHYSPWYFFERSMIFIPAVILLLGGCIGGLGRYHPAPKLRIIEPEDQGVIPPNFKIRIKYDPTLVQAETIELFVNNRNIPKKSSENNILIAPKIFKTPPKKAVSLDIKSEALDIKGKKLRDQIKVICDPDEDPEDYEDYWTFKQETYWSKEEKSASRSAKQGIRALQFIFLSALLLLTNALVTVIHGWIQGFTI
ncbi:MAG: hypothetical protein ACTSQE_06265 [Candidatus Heimdallarchaeaceae archaeon]